MTGQMRHPHPGRDQETSIVGDQMKALAAGSGVPADILVPVGTLPSRRAEEHASQRLSVAVAHQILQVLAHWAAVTQIVMPMKQVFKKGARVDQPAHFGDVQREQCAQLLQHWRLRNRHLERWHSLVTHAVGGNLSAWRQGNPAPLLQFEQQRPSGHVFELAGRVAPVPERGQMLAQATATPLWMPRQYLANLLQIGGANLPPLNETWFIHQPQTGKRRGRSPAQNETILAPQQPMAPESASLDSSSEASVAARPNHRRPG